MEIWKTEPIFFMKNFRIFTEWNRIIKKAAYAMWKWRTTLQNPPTIQDSIYQSINSVRIIHQAESQMSAASTYNYVMCLRHHFFFLFRLIPLGIFKSLLGHPVFFLLDKKKNMIIVFWSQYVIKWCCFPIVFINSIKYISSFFSMK